MDAIGLHPADVRSLDDLRHLAPLEKADLQQHGERMIARDWPRDDLRRNQTGGSTGTPVVFYAGKDRRQRLAQNARQRGASRSSKSPERISPKRSQLSPESSDA